MEKEKKDFWFKVISGLHKTRLMYAYIGELIGADNNMIKEEEAQNKERLLNLISVLNEFKESGETEIDTDELDKYIECATKSLNVFDEE
jgi:hypothetical protein